MTKWEIAFQTSLYLETHEGASGPDIADLWNSYDANGMTTFENVKQISEDGWELVSVMPVMIRGETRQVLFTFKRPIQEI